MAETRCDCCDLPTTMCGKAAERTQRAVEVAHRAKLLADPRWMEAHYPGTCAGCGERFDVGEPITLNCATDGHMWRASCCGVTS